MLSNYNEIITNQSYKAAIIDFFNSIHLNKKWR